MLYTISVYNFATMQAIVLLLSVTDTSMRAFATSVVYTRASFTPS
jgi:hypothetical protein